MLMRKRRPLALLRRGPLAPLSAVVTATAALLAGSAAVAAPGPAVAAPGPAVTAPVADIAHHGHATLWADRIELRLRTENRGPADVPASTVRLRLSAPLALRQQLPPGCVWGGRAAVLCETGELRSRGPARQTSLDLRLAGRPDEVVLRVDTVWNGGTREADPRNDEHAVLTPSTGDAYAF
ncbi:hypothetical protein [Streptomyces sp. NPDC101181]|uniref:hypothetical protein n=1 Tax=Streptomyces sp. NPDC101181 TaxID=3366125 RepID=UPI0038090666